MLDFGFGELLLLGAIALIALGPKQLPEVARLVGRFIKDMRRVAAEFAGTIVEARDATDRLLSPKPPAPTQPTPPPAAAGEGEKLALGDEAERGRQMSFALFDEAERGEPRA
jgi:Tat protein translocase TatB subunit